MDLRQIEAFNAVMSTGSMTRAGEMLGRSQSAVSRLIQEFEQEVGFTLFQRNGPKVIPTPQAFRLHSSALNAMHGMQQVARHAQDIGSNGADGIHVVAIPPLASGLVPRALARLPVALRSAHLQLRSFVPQQALQAVLSRAADIGLVYLPLDYRGLELHWLAEAAGVAVLPEDSPLARKEVLALADLIDSPLISYFTTSPFRFRVDATLAAQGLRPVQIIEVNSSVPAIQMVAAGLGVALLEPFVANAIAFPGVVVRRVDANIPFFFGAVSALGMPLSETAKALIGVLEETAREVIPDLVSHDPIDHDRLNEQWHSTLSLPE